MQLYKSQCGISDVRNIATNQRVLNKSAAITPELIPNLLIVIGITNGKVIAPTIGVNATNQRFI